MNVRKVTLGNPTITRRSVILPSGKEMTFTKGFIHKTSDQEELDFFSKAGGFQLLRLNEMEIREFIEKLDPIPTVDKRISNEEAQKYLWYDKDEEYVIEELKKRDFIDEKVGLDREAILAARKEMRMKGLKDDELLEECSKRNILPKEEEKELSEETMKELLKKAGYTVYKKKK